MTSAEVRAAVDALCDAHQIPQRQVADMLGMTPEGLSRCVNHEGFTNAARIMLVRAYLDGRLPIDWRNR